MQKATGMPQGKPNDDEVPREILARFARLSIDEQRTVCRRLLDTFNAGGAR